MDTSEHYLTKEEEQTLLRIARDTLEAYVRENRRVPLDETSLTDTLKEEHGAFVTLRSYGQLRGCIGYTANIEPLAKAVQENTINACARDPRFPPVTPDELQDIQIEISALTPGDRPDTPFKEVRDISEIVIGRDGLYIERPPMRGGVLLPQVAVEQGWNVMEFLSAVCRKAGYPDRVWEQPNTKLYRFSAQVFGEAPDAAPSN